MQKNKNYLIQSNYFTQSVLRDVSEIQKDIIYYIQRVADFYDENPPEVIVFNFEDFIKYKKVKKNNFYDIREIYDFCRGLISINGAFYNASSKTIEVFNIIDSVSISEENNNEFKITLAKFGKVFFYQKYAIDYAKANKIGYTQIESNIIDLKGDKRKKLFEILSQYKSTGLYKVELGHLKELLGFIVYKSKNGLINKKNEEKQLKFIFDKAGEIEHQYEKIEVFKVWSEFKRSFLDPAITDINNTPSLDISNLKYEAIKTGRKVTNLKFTFQRKFNLEGMDEEHKVGIDFFTKELELSEKQVLFLYDRIGLKNMYKRIKESIIFNPYYSNSQHPNRGRKIYFKKSTMEEIKNIGGYLYEKVFSELKIL